MLFENDDARDIAANSKAIIEIIAMLLVFVLFFLFLLFFFLFSSENLLFGNYPEVFIEVKNWQRVSQRVLLFYENRSQYKTISIILINTAISRFASGRTKADV